LNEKDLLFIFIGCYYFSFFFSFWSSNCIWVKR